MPKNWEGSRGSPTPTHYRTMSILKITGRRHEQIICWAYHFVRIQINIVVTWFSYHREEERGLYVWNPFSTNIMFCTMSVRILGSRTQVVLSMFPRVLVEGVSAILLRWSPDSNLWNWIKRVKSCLPPRESHAFHSPATDFAVASKVRRYLCWWTRNGSLEIRMSLEGSED